VLAELGDAMSMEALFARRGFAVILVPSLAALCSHVDHGGRAPSVLIVDLAHADARAALATFEDASARPSLVGILASDGVPVPHDLLDATFERPVDRARLFVRVVELVALRRKGRRRRKLSGLVGAIDGNDLFAAVAHELARAVPPVNAGAVLEAALRQLGTGPFVSRPADVVAIVRSGRLAEGLAPFGTQAAIADALARVLRLVEGRRVARHFSPAAP
jgi:hypothetical protein